MAKKTREEKIRSDKRRELSTFQIHTAPQTFKIPTQFNQPIKPIVATAPSRNYSSVVSDLILTMVLTLLAIGAQVCVYYLRGRG